MMESSTILLVDDEKNVLKSLKRLFIDSDYKIVTAESGEEGLKRLEEDSIQLVISDYRMPGMNGVEFLRKVKEKYQNTIRIILSGYADVAAVVEAINDGQIYKFLAKPWNEQELLTAIMRALEQYELQIENAKLTEELKKRNAELEELAKSLEDKVEKRTRDLELKNRALSISQNILNLLPVGVIGIDKEHTIVYINQSLSKYIDTASLTLGMPVPTSTSRSMQEVLKTICGALKEMKPLNVRLKTMPDVCLMCSPLANASGIVCSFIQFQENSISYV